MSINLAIKQLDADVLALGSPPAGSTAWFRLRALSTAASMLRAAEQKALEDPETFETYRRQCRHVFVNELGEESGV